MNDNTNTNGNSNGNGGALPLSSFPASVRRLFQEFEAEEEREAKAEAKAARSVPTKADTEAEGPVLTAAEIPWGEPVASTRDRSTVARLEYAIATGSDLENASPHLAAVTKWIENHPEGCDAYGAEPEWRDLLRFDIPKLLADDYESCRKILARGADIRVSHLDSKRLEARKSADAGEADGRGWTNHEPWTNHETVARAGGRRRAAD